LAAIVDPRSRRAYGDSRRPNRWRGDPGGGGDSQPDWFFFFEKRVGFYWYRTFTTSPLIGHSWIKEKLHISPLQKHPAPVAAVDRRCHSLELLHLPQWRK
jgi:hypothetical protein